MTLFVSYKDRPEWIFEPAERAKVGDLISLSLEHFGLSWTDEYEFVSDGEHLSDESEIGEAPRDGTEIVRVTLQKKVS